MSLGVKYEITPTVHWERPVSYDIRPLFTYNICYFEVYRHFFTGEAVIGVDFCG